MKFSLKTLGLLPAVALLAFGLNACSPAAEQEQQSPVAAAEEAVMVRHDSLMAQMDQVMMFKEKLKAARTPAADPYLHGLLAADNAMMTWMHAYQTPDTTVAEAQRLAYFQQQQQILENVEKQQRASLDSAAAFVKQLPAPAAK
jgi:hypothetical protein